jgi:hypothetical protein
MKKETSSSEGNNTLLISCTYLVCIVSIHILHIYLLEDNMFQEKLYLWKKNKIRIERMKYIKQIMWKLLQDKPKLESIMKRLRRSKDRKKSAIKRKLEKDL